MSKIKTKISVVDVIGKMPINATLMIYSSCK